MKILLLCALTLFLNISCASVLQDELLKDGIYEMRPADIKKNAAYYRGKTFILGGIIINTSVIAEGTLIEALFVPVNKRGYLKNPESGAGRFMALYRGTEILDPIIYRESREISIAGVFTSIKKGKIGEMLYSYPVFEIKQIYLWAENDPRDHYYMYPPYPYLPYRFRPYDTWRY
ncbi:MAG: Slp family lipoprotein [Nitrospira sp.]|nr:Slp family lipoprotein [bacterium]MBL7049652.1 Slp family lipoprotein [Nitrospira sp.]